MKNRFFFTTRPRRMITPIVVCLLATLAFAGVSATTAAAATKITIVHESNSAVAKAGEGAQIRFEWEIIVTVGGKEVIAYCQGTDFGGHVVGPNATSTSWKFTGSKKDLTDKFCGTFPRNGTGGQTNGGLTIKTLTVKALSNGSDYNATLSLSSAVEVLGGCKYEVKAVKGIRGTEGWGYPIYTDYGTAVIPLQKNVSQPPGCPASASLIHTELELRDELEPQSFYVADKL